ncbi:hypothetical protein BZL39_M05000 [Zygosaccharomyces parabailii]|nr:hypothetical protein BZL39_M05000 [Zygosaccharomyces parabailii]CDH10044.1 probable tyrosine decarboxylase [Zygosaccharomyces bailii ISA1307]
MDATNISASEQEKILGNLWKAAQGPGEGHVLPTVDQLNRARASLYNSLPEEGVGYQSVQRHILDDIVPAFNGGSINPNYYGFVTGGVTPAALFADAVVSAYDQNVQVHLQSHSIVTDVEFKTLGLLLQLLKLDVPSWLNGTFTTGATASNIIGLACGREFVIQKAAQRKGSPIKSTADAGLHEVLQSIGASGIQVLSTLPHSSLVKAAGVLGIGRMNVRDISTEANPLDIDLKKLQTELSRVDVVSIVAISCGEVNSGRFASAGLHELRKIRQLCDRHGAWLHVDGAFGIFGRLVGDDTEFMAIKEGCDGIELADSITGDAHKLLNVPYDCGFFFCRHASIAREVFQNANAAYLASVDGRDSFIPSPLNIGIENSRRFRALPVYASLLAYGEVEYRKMLHRQIRLARMIYGWIFDHPGYTALPETTSREELLDLTYMVVLFRAKDGGLNRTLEAKINATSRMFVSGTSWADAPACRIAISNWRVDEKRDFALVTGVLESALRSSGSAVSC